MDATFVCEHCGHSCPDGRMKELFVWYGRTRKRFEVCPVCLDKAMAGGRAHGMVGLNKRAAVQVTPGVDKGARQPMK